MRYALLSLLLLFLAACGSDDDVTRGEEGRLQLGRAEAQKVVERSVRLDGRTLVLDAEAGSVTVVGADTEEARLRFTQTARGASEEDAQEQLGRLSIEEAGDAEIYQYVLRTERAEAGQVAVEALVPREATLNIRLEQGDIRLSGTAGDVTVENGSGNVEAAGLAGRRVRLQTQLGNVEAGFAAVPAEADVRLATENGNVGVVLPFNASVDVDAETETGEIAVDRLAFTNRDLDQEGAQQRFRGRLGSGSADLRITTEVGTIRLAEGQRLELDDVEVFRPAEDSTVVPRGAPVAPNPPVQ
jgi:DUF4097 and DUF4098 domain-containing protein YvlB